MQYPTTIPLSDAGWRFGDVQPRPLAFDEDDRSAVTQWRAAQVPGHVHADLLDHDLIPDIKIGDNIAGCRWINQRDWWYEREIDIALRPGERAFLTFHGIDYLADIWWTSSRHTRRLTRHEGQFVTQRLELTHDMLRDGQTRTYTVGLRLWGAAGWPGPHWAPVDRAWMPLAKRLYPGKQSITPYHRRLGLLRNQMSFGWDFAPELPAPGIWDDVELRMSGDIHIVDAWVRSDPQRPILHLDLDATQPHDAAIDVAWELIGSKERDGLQARIDVRPGRQTVTIPLAIQNPKLWQPWEHANTTPHRYCAHVRIQTAVGLSDEYEIVFGLRNVVWDGWDLRVNGQQVYVRGVNWVPADLLPGRLRREDYASLLHKAKAAGVNLIRVWGGGLREKRAFYDLCDELGLLVWQEFPFACAFLDRYPTSPAYLARVERTAGDIVRAVRYHPSLVCWGAGNEYGPMRHHALLRRLRRAVVTHDGTRPLHAPSPHKNESHHWNVWHGFAPIHTYRDEHVSMASEFGLQALPAREMLEEVEPVEALWPPNTTWERRFGEREKLAHYARLVSDTMPATLDNYIAASQRAQAWGLQTMIEHQRRRRAGAIVWQFNEPWPAISWAIIDHYGRPKAAYDLLSRAYHPLLLSLKYVPRRYHAGDTFHAEVWAINDLGDEVDDASARIYQGDECVVAMPLTMPAGTARPVHNLHVTLREPPVLRVELWRDDSRLTWLEYNLTWYENEGMPIVQRIRRRLAGLVIRV